MQIEYLQLLYGCIDNDARQQYLASNKLIKIMLFSKNTILFLQFHRTNDQIEIIYNQIDRGPFHEPIWLLFWCLLRSKSMLLFHSSI